MSLSPANRSILERFTGPVLPDEEPMVVERIDRLGFAELAALEMLMISRAEMRRSAAKVRSADDSSDHSVNLAVMDQAVAELVGWINAGVAGGTVTLSTAGEALVASASGPVAPAVELELQARSRRRG